MEITLLYFNSTAVRNGFPKKLLQYFARDM